MKKYTTPNIEVTKFDVEDIIMLSSAGASASTETKAAAKEALTTAGYTVVEW